MTFKLLLTILAISLLSGCGGSGSSSENNASDNAPTETDDSSNDGSDPNDNSSENDSNDQAPDDNSGDQASAVDITDQIFTKTTANCQDYIDQYSSDVRDVNRNMAFQGALSIQHENGKCQFSTNAIPNHDFNDGQNNFVTNVSAQSDSYQITSSPSLAVNVTELSLQVDNALFLNGVKLDLLAAACYGVGDERIGCNDMNQPWRLDPMSALNNFGTDSHNAHTQPDGTYHYHGSPMAMFYTDTPIVSPVIGFAADGFPIRGSYFDDNGTVRKALSSYQLKQGARQAIDNINPGGTYNGAYRDDYEYVPDSGDLDECNGMMVDGSYSYFVTETYPWVMGCFKGTPDSSFNKR